MGSGHSKEHKHAVAETERIVAGWNAEGIHQAGRRHGRQPGVGQVYNQRTGNSDQGAGPRNGGQGQGAGAAHRDQGRPLRTVSGRNPAQGGQGQGRVQQPAQDLPRRPLRTVTGGVPPAVREAYNDPNRQLNPHAFHQQGDPRIMRRHGLISPNDQGGGRVIDPPRGTGGGGGRQPRVVRDANGRATGVARSRSGNRYGAHRPRPGNQAPSQHPQPQHPVRVPAQAPTPAAGAAAVERFDATANQVHPDEPGRTTPDTPDQTVVGTVVGQPAPQQQAGRGGTTRNQQGRQGTAQPRQPGRNAN